MLHGIDLSIAGGAAGDGRAVRRRKVDLGRLLAGIHGPRTGSVTVGGAPLIELPLRSCASTSRW